MDKGKGKSSSKDEGQSSSRKRPLPGGREQSAEQPPAFKKQKCEFNKLLLYSRKFIFVISVRRVSKRKIIHAY